MVFLGLLAVVFMSGCYCITSYIGAKNGIVARDEDRKAAWSEVQNQYKRRADLVPGLVEIVKGSAAHESDVLKAVTEARAKATATNIDVSKLANDPEAQKKFLEAQAQLGAAMSRMFTVVKEAYPDLKANSQFSMLQKQFEGTENRIAVARGDFGPKVREYNRFIKSGIWAPMVASHNGFTEKPYFEATEAEQAVPKINFGK
jgi:LemA protein